MNILEILLISIGLAMDAFSMAICKGLCIKKINLKKCLIVGLWFGLFQFLMPVIGFFLGSTFEVLITKIDHWIAFLLLFSLGIDMIFENSFSDSTKSDKLNLKTMFFLAVATSIDALAIGIAYVCAYGSYRAMTTFVTIGLITFITSIIGVIIGNKVGLKYEKKAKILGGIILIVMGIEILIEHLKIF